MKAGVYKNVKIVGCYIGEFPDKTPYFGLEFENSEGERLEKDFGLNLKKQNGDSNKEGVEKTLKLLLDAGFKGKELADMANPKFKLSDLFGEAKDILQITVEDKPWTTDSSKTSPSIKYFNVGEAFQKSKADHATAKMIFKSTTFDGLFAKLKKDGPSPKPAKESMQADSPDFTSDDVPF